MPLGRVRSVAVTPESATSVVLTRVLLPNAEILPFEEEADATLLIGDAALKSAFEDPTPHYDLGRLWLERTGLPMVFAVWAAPEPVVDGLSDLEHALVASVRLARSEPERLAYEASARYGYPAGFLARYFEKLRYSFGPRERAGLLHVPRDGARRGRARPRAGTALRPRSPGCRSDERRRERGAAPTTQLATRVRQVLDRALDGERISDDDAVTLLRSRDLVAVGRVAERAARPQDSTRTGSPSSSTATSTTRTSASPTATSAPSTAAPATRVRATCCRSRSSSRRSRRRSRSAAPGSSCREAITRTSASSSTRICSARSRAATASTCIASPRPRCSTSRAAPS